MSVSLNAPGGLVQWQAEPYHSPSLERRGLSVWRVAVLCIGFGTTAAALAGTWFACWPTTLVQTRIVADGPSSAGRAALAEAALRIGTAPGHSAMLDSHGDALVIAVEDDAATTAWQRARSLADTLLDLTVQPAPSLARHQVGGLARRARAALLSDRDRLTGIIAGIDARAAAVSASLTAVTRDMAAPARSPADRTGGRETLDKAASAIADLQLQRIQLAGRYQDDYPAVIALDGQIRSLRSFLQDETRRVDAAARAQPADTATATLTTERDRLRTELYQLNDRRVTLGAELASASRTLAATPPDPISTRSEVEQSAPAPLLIEAATTIGSGTDNRWLYMSGITLAGLFLSLVAWFKPRNRPSPNTTEQILLRLEASMLSPNAPGPIAPLYPALQENGRMPLLPPSQQNMTIAG